MATCAHCSSPIPEGGRFCPRCGIDAMSLSSTPTELADGSGSSPVARGAAAHGGASEAHGAQLVPGQRLGDRYRITGLIGRGGMGEVYRADDLKLAQPVALKLLPPALAHDPARLERFYAEVRIARQVSHPNVCRVYDVTEIDGRQVLTMEYIDGEDLSTLIRRIGRLAPDKAVEIARQICAGLAAAHDKGVLHRDLKPANIMLDGRGRARITDFGLAALIGGVKAEEIRSGTPIYMAPEQLHGREVTVRSDIYSLGVVLYEIFTGKRVFEAASMAELMKLHDWSRPASPSSLVEHLDPVIERVILRCLESEPADRPPSALAVAAALPGGDPLAAALAAGETPSPEMVAAAGGEGALRVPVAAACFAAFLAGLVVLAVIAPRTTLLGRAGAGKPPSVLIEKARELLAGVGYTAPAADFAYGIGSNYDYLKWIESHDTSPRRWADLSTLKKPAIAFWYRHGPFPLEPQNVYGVVWPTDPPPLVSGMAIVSLDSWGRLLSMTAVPPQVEEKAPETAPDRGLVEGTNGRPADGAQGASLVAGERSPVGVEGRTDPTAQPKGRAAGVGWSALFEGAGLDLASYREVTPQWLPLYFADARAAWEGPLPWQEGVRARVEAASYKGRPVYFTVLGPWSRPGRMQVYTPSTSMRIGQALNVVFFAMLLCGAVVLARWNISLGRGDRRSAFRLALFLFTIGMLGWLARADHVPSFASEWEQFVQASSRALFDAGLIWLLYIALEPFVRRRWPESIVGWTRLVGGGVRDPLVGRDLLVGAVFGVAMLLVSRSRFLLEAMLAGTQSIPPSGPLQSLARPGLFVAELLGDQTDAIQTAMMLLYFLFSGIGPLRSRWPGALIFCAIGTLMQFLFSSAPT